jgi:hypothetical protein
VVDAVLVLYLYMCETVLYQRVSERSIGYVVFVHLIAELCRDIITVDSGVYRSRAHFLCRSSTKTKLLPSYTVCKRTHKTRPVTFLYTGAFLHVRYSFLLISNEFCDLSLLYVYMATGR